MPTEPGAFALPRKDAIAILSKLVTSGSGEFTVSVAPVFSDVVVPIPTLPKLSMMNDVFVDEPTTNAA